MDAKVYSTNMQICNSFSIMQKRLADRLDSMSYKKVLENIQNQNVSAEKSTEEMTMEEFKAYIWEKIDSFPFSPTRPYDEETIKISDKCWERMKSDSEYEEKMMNIIKDGRAADDPFFGHNKGTYWILEFDGGEGCISHGFSKTFGGCEDSASSKFEKESEGGFWSSRRLQKKKLQAKIEEIVHQKREMVQEINEEVALKREIIMKQSVLGDNAPDLPITGVPAKYLLANLSVSSLNL